LKFISTLHQIQISIQLNVIHFRKRFNMGWILRTIVWGLARRFLGLPGIAVVGVLLYLYFTRDFGLAG